MGAQGAEFFVDAFVTAVDLADVINGRGALGGEGGDEEGHAGTHVGGFEAGAKELAFADDDDAVRVAEDDLGAHCDEGIDEEHSAFEHFFKEEDGALALGGGGDGDAHEVGGEGGPGGIVDLWDGVVELASDVHVLVGGDADSRAVGFDADAEFFEDHSDHAHVGHPDVFDVEFGACGGGQPDVGADFEVIGADGVFGAVEAARAVDRQGVGADALDVRAHGGEHPAEAFDVRLAGDVLQEGVAASEDGGHDGVFGGGDGGFVKEDVASHEAFGLDVVAVADIDRGAEPLEGQEVRVETAAADDVATRRGQVHLAMAGEHGAGKQNGRAHFAAEIRAEFGFVDTGTAQTDVVVADKFGFAAEILNDIHHYLDIANLWHIVQDDILAGEQAGREGGQDFVFVATRNEGAAEFVSAFDDKSFHDDRPCPKGRKARSMRAMAKGWAWQKKRGVGNQVSCRRNTMTRFLSTASMASAVARETRM